MGGAIFGGGKLGCVGGGVTSRGCTQESVIEKNIFFYLKITNDRVKRSGCLFLEKKYFYTSNYVFQYGLTKWKVGGDYIASVERRVNDERGGE